MRPKRTITDEIRDALRREPAKPLCVEDDVTQKVDVIVDEQAWPTLWDESIRREVQLGLAAIDRGEVEEWDIEATIAIAQRER